MCIRDSVYAARAKGAGGTVTSDAVYTLDRGNGAGTLEVAGGHTLDLLEHLCGRVGRLSASLSVQQPGSPCPTPPSRWVSPAPTTS